MSILAIINEVAATSSRNEKEAILRRNADNETLKSVFKAAYDPTINYFIKKIPPYTTMGGKIDLSTAITLLDDLKNRVFTGQAALDLLGRILGTCENQDDAKVIELIIQRDLKCGATDSTANKVWKGLIPEFPYMRCALPKDAKFKDWAWSAGVYSQLKADSMFANLDIISSAEGGVILTSRNGSEMPTEKFQKVVDYALDMIPLGYRLTGELQVKKAGKILPREIGNGILNSVLKGGDFGEDEEPVYSAWDIIPLEFAKPGGKYKVPYSQRFTELQNMIDEEGTPVHLIPTRIVYSLEEAYDHYFELIAQGLEGTVVKNPAGTWFDGTSKDQIKLKVEFDCDLEIVEFRAGNGKNEKTFGSIRCVSSDGLIDVNVGIGFTDKQREEIWSKRDEVIGKIMTVKSNMVLAADKNGIQSLFLPRHLEIREDKSTADSRDRVVEQFESIIRPKN